MRSWRSLFARPERISVAMATFDGERFLPEMLASLAEQTRRPDELVVRDDGSSDGTLEILRDFAERAPFPVHQVPSTGRLGYAQNFVAAGRACSGDLLFFADQDDVWRPEKLEMVAGAVRGSDPVVVSHDFALMDEDRAEIEPSFFGVLAERGFGPAVALKGCSLAMNRAFLDTWDWPPVGSGITHDLWVVLLATAFDERVILPEVLIDHRLHPDNTSGWIPDDSARVFTRRGDRASDVDVLIDLMLKKPRLRGPTIAFLDVLQERGELVDPTAARRLRRSLRTNRRLHREAAEVRNQPQGT